MSLLYIIIKIIFSVVSPGYWQKFPLSFFSPVLGSWLCRNSPRLPSCYNEEKRDMYSWSYTLLLRSLYKSSVWLQWFKMMIVLGYLWLIYRLWEVSPMKIQHEDNTCWTMPIVRQQLQERPWDMHGMTLESI